MSTSQAQKEIDESLLNHPALTRRKTVKTVERPLPPTPQDGCDNEEFKDCEDVEVEKTPKHGRPRYYVRDEKERSRAFGHKSDRDPHVPRRLRKYLPGTDPSTPSDLHLAYESKLEQYRREINDWKSAFLTLETTSIRREEDIENLQLELNKALAASERTKLSARHMEKAMDNKELFLGPQKTDDDIQTSFNGLVSSIKTWSANFLGDVGGESGPKWRQEELGRYLDVVPLCREIRGIEFLLAKKKMRRLFVRGWTAYVMSELVFRTLPVPTPGIEIPEDACSADLWLEESQRSSLLTLEKQIFYSTERSISPRAFNDWRAFTIDILSRSSSSSDPSSTSCLQIITAARAIMGLISPWASPDRHLELEDNLIAIFADAVKLSQLLRRQRALWYVRFPRPGGMWRDVKQIGNVPLMFDPSSMADEWSDNMGTDPVFLRQQYVEMVVSPALFKRGNVDGERYDVECPVVAASVLMRAPVLK